MKPLRKYFSVEIEQGHYTPENVSSEPPTQEGKHCTLKPEQIARH